MIEKPRKEFYDTHRIELVHCFCAVVQRLDFQMDFDRVKVSCLTNGVPAGAVVRTRTTRAIIRVVAAGRQCERATRHQASKASGPASNSISH